MAATASMASAVRPVAMATAIPAAMMVVVVGAVIATRARERDENCRVVSAISARAACV